MRRLAFVGVLWSAPVLLASSLLWRLAAGGPGGALEGLRRPLAYLLAPLRAAYEADRDLTLLAYLAWLGLLLLLLWARVGGTLYRMAAVSLTSGQPASWSDAHAFARRHWRAFVGSHLALAAAFLLPLLLAVALAALGRLPGWPGGILLAAAVVAAGVLASLAVLLGATTLLAGFLPGPTIACEDSDAFDAVSRTFGYAGAGLPRLVATRLTFLGGVLLGSAWRLLGLVAVVGLALLCLRAGAGAAAFDRALAVVDALGRPADADRLGTSATDYVVALALAATLFVLFARWVADALARVVCGRTAAYLLLRESIDRIAIQHLRTRPPAPAYQTAEEAGFEEQARLGEA